MKEPLPVSTAAENALRDAMHRLLAGKPERTDGALTITGLAKEAALSRSTANRARAVLEEFRAAVEARGETPESPETYLERIHHLENEIIKVRKENAEENERLRETVKILAQRIQVLSLENEYLRRQAGRPLLRPLPAMRPEGLGTDTE